MEKLLHERLREHSDDDCSFKCDEYFKASISRKAAEHLANEIERDYIPREQHEAEIKEAIRKTIKPLKWFRRSIEEGEDWPHPREGESFREYLDRVFIMRPRYEDGEPVQFGDAIEEDGEWKGVVREIAFCGDGTIILLDETPETIVETKLGYPVTRYAPKVYDADGVEIKVGDTVYGVREGDAVIVIGVVPDDGSIGYDSVDIGAFMLLPSTEFTHEKPVFDANGERICKGDAVWDKYCNRVIVADLNSPCHPGLVSASQNGKPPLTDYHPDELTHQEPDSLESIAKYAKDEAVKYAGCIEPLNNLADRLTALIERGA